MRLWVAPGHVGLDDHGLGGALFPDQQHGLSQGKEEGKTATTSTKKYTWKRYSLTIVQQKVTNRKSIIYAPKKSGENVRQT